MPAARLVLAASVIGLATAVSGCGAGSGGGAASPQAAKPVGQRAEERYDAAVDGALDARHRAALAGDRIAVGRAQRELDRLAAADPKPKPKSAAADAFERFVDDFAFKRAPLFVQQIATTDGSHRIDVSVDRAAFCLLTADARLEAVHAVFGSADRALRRHAVSDLRFVVVPLTSTAATLDQALAIGEHGRVRLTARGRRC